VTLSAHNSPPLITFQFHPLVVLLSEMSAETYFHVEYTPHLALKGLREKFAVANIYIFAINLFCG